MKDRINKDGPSSGMLSGTRRKRSTNSRRHSMLHRGSPSLMFLFFTCMTVLMYRIPTVHCVEPSIGRKLSRMLGFQTRSLQTDPISSDDEGSPPHDFWTSLAEHEQANPQRNDDKPAFLVALRKILDDPSEVLRNIGNGMKLGLAAYSAVLVWKLYTELSKAIMSESDGGNNRSLIESLISLMEERGSNPQHTKLWDDGRSQQWIQLIQKLHASGMPLRSTDSSEQPSVVEVLSSLTKAEVSILHQCLVDPRAVDDSERIFGLNFELQQLEEMIRQLGKHSNNEFGPLFGPANKPFSWPGILLYGPPGCGKSMLIRHAAADAKVPCLTITPSLLLRKFVGESNLQVRALFTLIGKLSPCILFIDEIDGLFRERSADEHHVSREIKTEFLQYWDGLLSNSSVLVVGATNRPFDLDSAVLRRLPQCWYVDPPHTSVRKQLWSHWLKKVPTENNINVDKLVGMTEGYTHSDIRHVLQVAALEGPIGSGTLKISGDDIVQALSSVSGSRLSDLYKRQLWSFISKHDEGVLKNSVDAWETRDGRFYSLGTLIIDANAIRLIMDIVKELQDADGTNDNADDDDEDDV